MKYSHCLQGFSLLRMAKLNTVSIQCGQCSDRNCPRASLSQKYFKSQIASYSTSSHHQREQTCLTAQIIKNLPAMQETCDPGLGRSPGEGNGNPLQYSCLENPMDRAWWLCSLVGYSLWSCKELDTTEQLTHHQNFLYSFPQAMAAILKIFGPCQLPSIFYLFI